MKSDGTCHKIENGTNDTLKQEVCTTGGGNGNPPARILIGKNRCKLPIILIDSSSKVPGSYGTHEGHEGQQEGGNMHGKR